MNKIIERGLIYSGLTTIALACGAAALTPAWERHYDHHTTITMTPSIDHQSVYVLQSTASDHPNHLEQIDLSGNVTRTFEVPGAGSTLKPIALSERTLFLKSASPIATASMYIDLESSTTQPAFPAEFTASLQSLNIKSTFVQDDGDLVFHAAAIYRDEYQETQLLGHLHESGSFTYTALPEQVASISFIRMGNTTGYITRGTYRADYTASSGLRSFIQFLDAELNTTAEINLSQLFIMKAGFNDRAYGYFSNRGQSPTYVFIDIDGNELPDHSSFSNREFLNGERYFYTYPAHAYADMEFCRHDYTLQLINCFTIPTLGTIAMLDVTTDDSIGISQYRTGEQILGLNISFAEFDGSLLGSGNFPGIYDIRYYHRTYSPQGKLILNGRAEPYIEKGNMKWCDGWHGESYPCLAPDTYTAGVCNLYGATYLNQSQLISAQRWCDPNTENTTQISMWQQ